MSEKCLTIPNLAEELENIVSSNRLRQELCRAEYAKYLISGHPLKFILNVESRKLLYDRLLSSPIIRGRLEAGLKCNNTKKKVKNST